jgi:hypothetical protein
MVFRSILPIQFERSSTFRFHIALSLGSDKNLLPSLSVADLCLSFATLNKAVCLILDLVYFLYSSWRSKSTGNVVINHSAESDSNLYLT